MTDFKHHRESENRIHEQLYENLFLLSQFYPTSGDFNAVLKKDMFVKNNKAAFFECVYYLLNILNPQVTKEKLTAWPPYDIKRENKFRMEVLMYVNELNSLYDNADTPHIMSSHFISPGGLKFTKFMLSLSQLVVYEHLRKTADVDILYCPKASKNVEVNNVNLNNLRKKTNLIAQETKDIVTDFVKYHFDSKERAISMDEELKQLNENIREAKKQNSAVREEFLQKHSTYPSPETLKDKVSVLKCQYEGLQEICELYKECESFVSYLKSNELVLEHVKQELKIPNEILHIVKNCEELDLTDFFHGLNTLLEKKALEFPYPTGESFNLCNEKMKELTVQSTEVNKYLSERVKKLQDLVEKVLQQIKLAAELVRDNESEEILAVPISD